MENPVKVIDAIRNSFPGAIVVYTRGGCFEFFKILKAIYPDAEPFYDHMEGHVYTKVDGKFYDIKGRAYLREENLSCMSKERQLVGNAHRWMPNSNFRVVRLMDEDA